MYYITLQILCNFKHRSTSFLAVFVPAFFVYIVSVSIDSVAKASSNINTGAAISTKSFFKTFTMSIIVHKY